MHLIMGTKSTLSLFFMPCFTIYWKFTFSRKIIQISEDFNLIVTSLLKSQRSSTLAKNNTGHLQWSTELQDLPNLLKISAKRDITATWNTNTAMDKDRCRFVWTTIYSLSTGYRLLQQISNHKKIVRTVKSSCHRSAEVHLFRIWNPNNCYVWQ